ncbi:MAG: hypothetical protein Q4D03_02375, partial [Bacteroidales bacterium]|nr:hypothetical protein [Bacteroidales bacterium]
CKDTTIFETAKFFFQIFPHPIAVGFLFQRFKVEKKIQIPTFIGQNRPLFLPLTHPFFRKIDLQHCYDTRAKQLYS